MLSSFPVTSWMLTLPKESFLGKNTLISWVTKKRNGSNKGEQDVFTNATGTRFNKNDFLLATRLVNIKQRIQTDPNTPLFNLSRTIKRFISEPETQCVNDNN